MKNQFTLSLALSLSLTCLAEAKILNFQKLNEEFQGRLKGSAVASQKAHKMPNFFVSDSTVSLTAVTEGVVEDIYSKPTLTTRVSTLTTEELDARNAAGLAVLEDSLPNGDGLSKEEAEALLAKVHAHPVVGIAALETYDRDSETGKRFHGFCFGRADFIYYELLKMGIPKSSIYKIFQIGSINGDPTFGRPWRNHIVTIVKGKKGGWYAMDPFYNQVMTPSEWVQKNRDFASANSFKTMAFIGKPDRMYAQGGENTAEGIADLSFPLVRARATPPGKDPAETLFVLKDERWQKYYNDMMAAVVEDNNGVNAEYFCQESKVCPKKTRN
jgi:hypothetical protein